MTNNLDIYNAMRSVPQEAQKSFNNGRFSGTDINAMWRIKKLTETFGIVGFGWRTELVKEWTELGANDEVKAFVMINLYVKVNDEWSAPIVGIGGSHFISKTKNGLQNNDECYKMAYTDAIGVACKALGMGADIYWDSDKSKYTDTNIQHSPVGEEEIWDVYNGNKYNFAPIIREIKAVKNRKQFEHVMNKYKEYLRVDSVSETCAEIAVKFPKNKVA